MAQLWMRDAADAWTCLPLDSHQQLAVQGERVELVAPTGPPAGVVLHRVEAMSERAWALLAPHGSEAWVSGRRVHGGIRVLANRDSIRVNGSAPVYFSTEVLANVEAFPAPSGDPLYCARCKLELVSGVLAVKCPSCGIWHHEDAANRRLCWSYGEQCSLCSQPTALDAGYRWTPAEL